MFSRTVARRAAPAASAACSCFRTSFTMPLRAKIVPQGGSRAMLSTQRAAEIFREKEGDEPEDVAFNSLYGLRTIELNRPAKLNSLNASMIRKVGSRLVEWSKSDMANVIVMKGAGDRAFCAGGDVAHLAKSNKKGAKGQEQSVEYFALEYQLDHLIATYGKPYIAFMDGITMGGGVGLSAHAPFRIATERTMFAMPETTIGFFPDVGASFFLPRMAGKTGTYLALTSERLTGANAFYAGIATHYLHSTSLPLLESRLAELRFKDYDDLRKRLTVINSTIEEFSTGLPPDQPILLGGELRRAIDRCFASDNINSILSALKTEAAAADALGHEGKPIKDWAEKTIETLHKRSPTSVHVALRQMQIGRKWSISETFVREHQIAAKFMASHDFVEGVGAQLLSKPRREPQWQPARLEDIAPGANVSEPYFLMSKELKPLELLSDGDYKEYPFKEFGLPTEAEVENLLRDGPRTRSEILEHFVAAKKSKQGVREVVDEIVSRMTVTNAEGKCEWQPED